MAKISRIGDQNTTGGKIMQGANKVYAEGKPVGTHSSLISPHAPWGKPHPPHNAAKTTEGSPKVFAEGKPVLRVGSGNTCGHKIVEGASKVNVP
jgi:uncharacterized Zn-binding protein involved in type VI secretion